MNITYPYLVVSDIHFHNWTFGSYTTTDGINSRLQDTIDEFKRASETLNEAGGKDIIITGDLFHTRGEIKPTVFNPVYAMFTELSEQGFKIWAIPGNHDLESEESEKYSNSFDAFSGIPNFNIFYSLTPVNIGRKEVAVFMPWTENIKFGLNSIKCARLDESCYPTLRKITIFAHVGLSGVVSGIGNSLDPTVFGEIKGIKNVFCGHFHNHKHFPIDDGTNKFDVYSVGALTHQSFKDVGSKAGYLIVHSDSVHHFATKAPKFVDYNEDDWVTSHSPLLDKIQGNFVRIKTVTALSTIEIGAIYTALETSGALKIINASRIDDKLDLELGERAPPPHSYTFGRRVSISKEFEEYVMSKYDKNMANKMLTIFNKDGIDE